jgi:uncharacterized OB-fold protein
MGKPASPYESLFMSRYRSVCDDLLGRGIDNRWHLQGMRCRKCRETAFGLRSRWCQHCGSDQVFTSQLNDRGSLWSFTVVRNPPPGKHHLPEPFRPLALGLVEIEESGLRILSPIDVPLNQLVIGLPVQLDVHSLFKDDEDFEVVAFRFKAANHD